MGWGPVELVAILFTTLIIGVWWQSGDVSPATCSPLCLTPTLSPSLSLSPSGHKIEMHPGQQSEQSKSLV